MGLYDTVNQVSTGIGQVPNGNSFAQKQPMDMFAKRKQMQSNPVMAGRPAMTGVMNKPQMAGAAIGAANTMNNYMKPNPMTGARPGLMNKTPGMMGSRPDIMRKQQTADYNKPLAPAQGLAPTQLPFTPSTGIAGPQTPYDQQQQEQLQTQAAANPLQAANEEMRDYAGPDLGSQDPREIARMQSLQAPPFGGENIPPTSNAFQEMLARSQGARPDVMSRGLGPSVVMDENGLEPRRGAR